MQSFIDRLHDHFRAEDPAIDVKREEAEQFRLLQDAYRHLTQGDFSRFVELLAEDIEFEIVGPASLPFLGKWNGKDEVVQAIQRNFSKVEQQEPEIKSVVAQGNQIVVIAREEGRYRDSGAAYNIQWVQLFTLRGGKLARILEIVSGDA